MADHSVTAAGVALFPRFVYCVVHVLLLASRRRLVGRHAPSARAGSPQGAACQTIQTATFSSALIFASRFCRTKETTAWTRPLTFSNAAPYSSRLTARAPVQTEHPGIRRRT